MHTRQVGDTIAARYARLFDRSYKRDLMDHAARVVAGVLVVAAICLSLYFLSA